MAEAFGAAAKLGKLPEWTAIHKGFVKKTVEAGQDTFARIAARLDALSAIDTTLCESKEGKEAKPTFMNALVYDDNRNGGSGSNNSSSSSNNSGSGGGSSGSYMKGDCRNCGVAGHWERSCHNCSYCGKPNHKADDCFHKQRDRNDGWTDRWLIASSSSYRNQSTHWRQKWGCQPGRAGAGRRLCGRSYKTLRGE